MEYNYRYPYFAILVIGIGIGIFTYTSLTKACRTILVLSIVTLMIEISAYWLGLGKVSNSVLYNGFMVIQPALLGFAFIQETSYRPIIVLTLLTTASVLIFWLTSVGTGFNTNGLVLVLTFMVATALIFFYLLLKRDTSVPLRHFPFFWISTGFLIFGVLNILGFGFIYIFKVENIFLNSLFKSIRIYSNYFLYALFIPAFLVPQNSLKNA